MKEVNFIGKKFSPGDEILFNDDDILHTIADHEIMAHLVHRAGCFKSVGDAKRNGWNIPIPAGWSEFRVGNKFTGTKIFVWNPIHSLDEWIILESGLH